MDVSNESFAYLADGIIKQDLLKKYNDSEGRLLSKFILKGSSKDVLKLSKKLLTHYKYRYYKGNSSQYNKKGFQKINGIISSESYKLKRNSNNGILSDLLSTENIVNTDDQINHCIHRLENPNEDPEAVIGNSKDLLEATYKYILYKLHKPFNKYTKMKPLRVDVMVCLNMVPAKDKYTREHTVSGMSSNMLHHLISVLDLINYLRNQFGTGHGKGPKHHINIHKRYSQLCLGSTAVCVDFLIATLRDHLKNHPNK